MKRIFIFTILSLCIVSGGKAQQIDYKATAFNLFLNGKISQWPWVINKMVADPKLQDTEGQLEILLWFGRSFDGCRAEKTGIGEFAEG